MKSMDNSHTNACRLFASAVQPHLGRAWWRDAHHLVPEIEFQASPTGEPRIREYPAWLLPGGFWQPDFLAKLWQLRSELESEGENLEPWSVPPGWARFFGT
jgi:hypothetical protein